jgi:tetratricopeptide (TPR) repeat protein
VEGFCIFSEFILNKPAMTKITAAPYRLLVFLVFFWLLILSPPVVLQLHAQSNYWPDSLKRELARAKELPAKARWAVSLAIYYFGIDSVKSEEYSRQAIESAEMSRDRMVMIMTFLRNAAKYMQSGGLTGNLNKAMDNCRRAEQIAKDEKLDAGLVQSDCEIALIYRVKGDNVQALAYANQAVATAAETTDDSLQVQAYGALGDTYDRMNEKLLAFRNYLKALDVAELSKDNDLQRTASGNLLGFYSGINEYDKAIDYGMRMMDFDRKSRLGDQLAQDYNEMGILFGAKKEYDLALEMFERSLAVADSIHFDLIRLNSYFAIFQMYFSGNQFKKGFDYINSHPAMMDFVEHAGLRYFLYEYYGNAYTGMGRYDSAAWYLGKAEPEVEGSGGVGAKIEFYDGVGDFYRKKGNVAKAIAYYQKERALGVATGNIKVLRDCGLDLDSLYVRAGDYRSAYEYHVEYVAYGDSMRNLAKATDLLKLEVDNDNRRRERQVKEEVLSREHRHNVQYMGFTVGLVVLFIALVMMGWLAVPVSFLRALGFLSFIFLFEFIILLADKTIQAWTHEEPWKILLIKIGLAAILVPLHHWLEHKVIHFLSQRKRLAAAHQEAAAHQGATAHQGAAAHQVGT